jgi:hypothetical protein
MLYVQDSLTVIPHGGFGGELHDIMRKDYLPDVEQKGMRLVGLFMVGIRYNEHFALWEIDDWSALDRLQEYHEADPWMEMWALESVRYRTDWVRRVLEPARFSPTLAQIQQEDKYRAMMYLLCLSRLVPGTVDEYIEAVETEAVPMAASWGRTLVGCYRTVAGHADSNEVMEVWATGNTNAEYGAIRDVAQKDPALARWEAKVGEWRTSLTCRMLYGVVSFSPLRGADEYLRAMDIMRAR